jgi:hypothetical protein
VAGQRGCGRFRERVDVFRQLMTVELATELNRLRCRLRKRHRTAAARHGFVRDAVLFWLSATGRRRNLLQLLNGVAGSGSVFDVHRVAAEVLDIAWDKVDVSWGNTSKYVPNTCGQGGSQT